MNSKRIALGLGLLLITAGCLTGTPVTSPTGDGTTTSTSVPTSTTALNQSDSDRLTEKPLPERPENLDQDTVVPFVEDYERAYTWNQELTNNTTKMAVSPTRVEILNVTKTGFVVHLEVGFSKTIERSGDTMSGGGFYTVNYFVNETVLMRAQTSGQARPGPDPRNGTVIEG